MLRMISPLAEGADRLAAQAALEHGFQLEVPLPFNAFEYEKDFPATTRAISRAAGGSRRRAFFALDGGRGEAENRSYEAAGRLVVHNIATCCWRSMGWRPESRGQRRYGGNRAICGPQYGAARLVDPGGWAGPAPGWLAGAEAARNPAASPRGGAAAAMLEAYRAPLRPACRHSRSSQPLICPGAA